MAILSLNFLVLNDPLGYIIPIKIAADEPVASLQRLIKHLRAPEFDRAPADHLACWSVSIPAEDYNEQVVKSQLTDKSFLSSHQTQKLSKFFSNPLADHIHVVVRSPILTLHCLVAGDDPSRIAIIEIPASSNVAALKAAIQTVKKPNLDHVPAASLDIFRVSLPLGEHLKLILEDFQHERDPKDGVYFLSQPLQLLDTLFIDPVRDHVHIIVRSPYVRLPYSQLGVAPPLCNPIILGRKNWIKKFPLMRPSEKGKPATFALDQNAQEGPAFRFSWPISADVTIPITLYNSIFGQFQDDCETYDPTPADHDFALTMWYFMAQFYSDELMRISDARALFAEYGINFAISEDLKFRSDGDMRFMDHCFAILEAKNELASASTDPLLQAAWHFIALTSAHLEDKESSHLPCLIFYLDGPNIGFAGALWTDSPHLQVLTPMLPLFYHRSDVNMRMQTARHFGAAKKAILRLKEYYESRLSLTSSSIMFPYPTHFLALDTSERQTFKYLSHPYSDKLLFHAISGETKLCIKFVHEYSQKMHRTCASWGLAPALRGFEEIYGGWYMVVMDALDHNLYCNLADSPVKASFEAEVRREVIRLHQEGFVHGDLRDTNIMVKKNGTAGMKLLDYDWAGEIGDVQYPMYVNHVDINRPRGVVGGQLIMAEHDMEMIDYMFK